MKLSSKTALSEPSQARAWAPLDLALNASVSHPDITAKVLSIFTPVSGQTPTVAPIPAKKSLIRAVNQPPSLFSAWQPGEVEMVRPILPEEVVQAALFPSAPPPVRRPVTAVDPTVAILADAHRKADEILLKAQKAAEESVQRTLAQSEQAIAEGYAKGREEARAEAASSIQSAQSMITELATWRDGMIAQSEETIIGMIRQIARLMFGSGIRLDKDVLQTYLNEVVENTRSLGDLNIFLNPDDFAQLEPAWAERQAQVRGSRVRVASSAAVLPGGCLIKGQMGSMDASVETKLAAVLDTLSSDADAGAQE